MFPSKGFLWKGTSASIKGWQKAARVGRRGETCVYRDEGCMFREKEVACGREADMADIEMLLQCLGLFYGTALKLNTDIFSNHTPP